MIGRSIARPSLWAFTLGLALAALSFVFDARGDAPSRVLVLTPPGSAPRITDAALRLAGELRGAGFEVDLVEHRPADDPFDTGAGADPGKGTPPIATIFLTEAKDGASADVWVSDHITHKILARHMTGDGDADALAIRAAELLRASMLELAIDPKTTIPEDLARWIGPSLALAKPQPASPSPSPPPEKVRPPAPAPTPARSSRRAVSEPERPAVDRVARVGAGFAALVTFGGFTPAIGPALDLRCRLAPGFDLLVRVAVPLESEVIRDPNDPPRGKATVRHVLATAALEYRFAAADAPLRPGVGAGLGAYAFDASVQGFSGHPSFHRDVPAFTPSIESDVEMRFHDRVRGNIGVSALFPIPDPVLWMGPSRVGHAGEPLVLGTLGVAVAL